MTTAATTLNRSIGPVLSAQHPHAHPKTHPKTLAFGTIKAFAACFGRNNSNSLTRVNIISTVHPCWNVWVCQYKSFSVLLCMFYLRGLMNVGFCSQQQCSWLCQFIEITYLWSKCLFLCYAFTSLWMHNVILNLEFAQSAVLQSRKQWFYNHVDCNHVDLLMGADPRGFLLLSKLWEPQMSHRCVFVGPLRSEVCFNVSPAWECVINFDAWWSLAEWAGWSCG